MTIRCTKCLSDKVVKNGKAPSGSQKYKCKECAYAFVEHPKNKPISEETKLCVDLLLKEKLSLAGIARSLKISKRWLQGYVNNKYKNIS
jgi:insertion element IS1 protein InsB